MSVSRSVDKGGNRPNSVSKGGAGQKGGVNLKFGKSGDLIKRGDWTPWLKPCLVTPDSLKRQGVCDALRLGA